MNILRKKKPHDVYSDTCENHHGKEVLFCPDCDYIYCLVCRVTGHHDIPHNFKPINSIAEKFEKSEEFENYMENISTLKDETDSSSRTIEENIILANKYKDEADKKIMQQGDALIKLIQKHVRLCYNKNKKIHVECVSRLEDCSNKICELKTQIEQIEKEINIKREKRDKSSMFITVQKSKHDVIRIDEEIGQINQKTYVTGYEFKTKQQPFHDLKNVDAFGVFVEMSPKSETVTHSMPKSDLCLSRSPAFPVFQEKKETEEGNVKPHKAESNLSLNETQPFRKNDEFYAVSDRGDDQETYRVLYQYKARSDDELSIHEGDMVNVVEMCDDGNWLMAELNGQSGYVPANYVERCCNTDQPVRMIDELQQKLREKFGTL